MLEWDGRGWGMILNPDVLEFHVKWAKHVPCDLYGGVSTEASDALVTGHAPRWRIAYKKNKIHVADEARYLYWHAARRFANTVSLTCEQQHTMEYWFVLDEHSSLWPYEGIEVDPRLEGKSFLYKEDEPQFEYGQTTWTPYMLKDM